MNRLVSFGCSFTFGHGLPDCYIAEHNLPGFEHSKMAWPSVLAERLNLDLINISSPGASNERILTNILNAEFESTDTVVILWSFIHRGLIFNDDGSDTEVRPMTPSAEREPFFKLHTDYDMLVKTLLYIHHATQYLENNKIKVHNCYMDFKMKHWLPKAKTHKKLVSYANTMQFISFTELLTDRALDDSHPGIISHRNIANAIYNSLKEKNE